MTIEHITSRQILDSRGQPTLETTVHLDAGVSGTAAVPAGRSVGSHEAVELRDDDPKHYGGRGVLTAIDKVTGPIAKALQGQDVRDQRAVDRLMIDLDGTVNKSNLGGNAILSVSLAAARARAALLRQPLYRSLQESFELPEIDPEKLPRPMMNILNGGKHADTEVKVQEFLVIPQGQSPAEQIERGVAVYHALGAILRDKALTTTLGDEGGYAPRLKRDDQALTLVMDAIGRAELRAPDDVDLAIDVAASSFYDAASRRYAFGQTKSGLSAVGMIGLIEEWAKAYPLRSVEDPLAEDDWDNWTALTAKLGGRTMLVGDDLFVTNEARLSRGAETKAANTILLKPNQAGTLTETVETAFRAHDLGYTIIVSHRSGETVDPFIVDLAVALGAPFLKAGAPARGERVAKYNRLLTIADELAA